MPLRLLRPAAALLPDYGTSDPENIASLRVMEANGGRLVERGTHPPPYQPTPMLRYRISLPRP